MHVDTRTAGQLVVRRAKHVIRPPGSFWLISKIIISVTYLPVNYLRSDVVWKIVERAGRFVFLNLEPYFVSEKLVSLGTRVSMVSNTICKCEFWSILLYIHSWLYFPRSKVHYVQVLGAARPKISTEEGLTSRISPSLPNEEITKSKRRVHRCTFKGCGKEYKQLSGLRYHILHVVIDSCGTSSLSSDRTM